MQAEGAVRPYDSRPTDNMTIPSQLGSKMEMVLKENTKVIPGKSLTAIGKNLGSHV